MDIIEFGHVQRAFIGVQISDVSQEQASELGLKDVSGVFVKSLTEGGAAAESGIKQGDVIQKIGEIAVKNVPELQEQVSKHRPGDKIKVGVWRDGKQQLVEVTLRNKSGKAQLDDFSAAPEESYQSLGATFVAPSSEEVSSLRITGGAKISDIQSGKFKSLGMQRGFIITRIGDQKVNSPDELKAAFAGKEGSYIEIRGMYANGMEAMYGFKL